MKTFRACIITTARLTGVRKLPVSGAEREFKADDFWLKKLASKDYFAVRLGKLKFRGFKPKRTATPDLLLTDDDFKPDFEQKGVDMRIGLDIATFSHLRTVDRIALVTNDTDCIPAMKYARKHGLQIVLMGFPGVRIASELVHHADFHRRLADWP